MLTIEKLKTIIDTDKIMKPAMVIDSSVIRAKYAQLTNLIDGVKLFYASSSSSPSGSSVPGSLSGLF